MKQEKRKSRIKFASILLLLLFPNFLCAKIIHVSSSGNDSNAGTINDPVRTLTRAKELCLNSSDNSFEILLKGGDIFTEFYPDTVSLYGDDRTTFAFIWDINKELLISTYGSDEKAKLDGTGYFLHDGGPGAAILVIEPSKQNVIIENLYFEMWIESTIMLFETEDVILRNIKINKIGPYYFPDEKTTGVYCAGVVYPKNSTRVLIENIEMTNCHNNFEELDDLHGFYCTRLNNSEIRNCYLANISGSPFKFRRSQANNVYVHDNECYYTGVSTQTDNQVQFGFLRYSGDPGGNCPYALTFENNIFHYPYLWVERGENPETSYAIKCSISNITSCGADACDDSTKVKWINNDFKFKWELTDKWNGGEILALNSPGDLLAVAVSNKQIDLTWIDNSENEEGFKIERKSHGSSYWDVGKVDANVTSHSDRFFLNSSTEYTYRVVAYYENITSPPSNEVTVTTQNDLVNVSDENELTVPSVFDLEQNYPNPFNPSTTINYQLPKSGKVQLVIFNIHGQLVETLVNKYQSSGYFQALWHPKDLPSGVYYYQLRSNDFIKTQKLVLLK
ncbi:MAG: T9SS type A sorting domain-containing protein [Bacteroidetes bacterium]|nr:T9SS type A sorting domain-containing protein [Bacteroidota bacterium]